MKRRKSETDGIVRIIKGAMVLHAMGVLKTNPQNAP